ncbi:MAG: sigma-70 family RNA polymerase sigma factor [Planctomycetota bacterium]
MVRLRDNPEPSEGHLIGLVRRAAGGSESALEELYRACEQPVFGLCLRILRDERAAEEATVEVFQRAWDRAATFDPERGKVLAWMLTMTRSVALEALRTRRRESSGRVELEAAELVAGDGPGPLVTSATSETAARVEAALRALPKEQERVLRAAYFGGLSYREVAEAFGQPLGTVKTRIRAGLAALRRALAPEGELA